MQMPDQRNAVNGDCGLDGALGGWHSCSDLTFKTCCSGPKIQGLRLTQRGPRRSGGQSCYPIESAPVTSPLVPLLFASRLWRTCGGSVLRGPLCQPGAACQ